MAWSNNLDFLDNRRSSCSLSSSSTCQFSTMNKSTSTKELTWSRRSEEEGNNSLMSAMVMPMSTGGTVSHDHDVNVSAADKIHDSGMNSHGWEAQQVDQKLVLGPIKSVFRMEHEEQPQKNVSETRFKNVDQPSWSNYRNTSSASCARSNGVWSTWSQAGGNADSVDSNTGIWNNQSKHGSRNRDVFRQDREAYAGQRRMQMPVTYDQQRMGSMFEQLTIKPDELEVTNESPNDADEPAAVEQSIGGGAWNGMGIGTNATNWNNWMDPMSSSSCPNNAPVNGRGMRFGNERSGGDIPTHVDNMGNPSNVWNGGFWDPAAVDSGMSRGWNGPSNGGRYEGHNVGPSTVWNTIDEGILSRPAIWNGNGSNGSHNFGYQRGMYESSMQRSSSYPMMGSRNGESASRQNRGRERPSLLKNENVSGWGVVPRETNVGLRPSPMYRHNGFAGTGTSRLTQTGQELDEFARKYNLQKWHTRKTAGYHSRTLKYFSDFDM